VITFVILAAGQGTRMGRVGTSLHKCLVPLDGRAVISHQLELIPADARVVVVTGYRAEQVETYLRLAHPYREVTIVHAPGGGPGRALMEAGTQVRGDLVYMSCDTLWEYDPGLWSGRESWAAVAPVPAGTPPARWCRMVVAEDGHVTELLDKRRGGDAFSEEFAQVYTGLARVVESDLPAFWNRLQSAATRNGEWRDPPGFEPLIEASRLKTRRISWIDVGDEAAYRRAVLRLSGYDWTKPDEATWILPEEGRVVKYWADPTIANVRLARGMAFKDAVPKLIEGRDNMLAYGYVPGSPLYSLGHKIDNARLFEWAEQMLWRPARLSGNSQGECYRFYRDKTNQRVEMLPPHLRQLCQDVVARVDWKWLAEGCEPVRPWHGDFNYGNLIAVDPPLVGEERSPFVAIDWREDFAGRADWGDRRYDVAKLLAGCYVHWDNARRGDMRLWPIGIKHADEIRNLTGRRRDVDVIGALSLLNCAPLHASPLDEVLVARGTAWLEEVVT
jgi:choline kinase